MYLKGRVVGFYYYRFHVEDNSDVSHFSIVARPSESLHCLNCKLRVMSSVNAFSNRLSELKSRSESIREGSESGQHVQVTPAKSLEEFLIGTEGSDSHESTSVQPESLDPKSLSLEEKVTELSFAVRILSTAKTQQEQRILLLESDLSKKNDELLTSCNRIILLESIIVELQSQNTVNENGNLGNQPKSLSDALDLIECYHKTCSELQEELEKKYSTVDSMQLELSSLREQFSQYYGFCEDEGVEIPNHQEVLDPDSDSINPVPEQDSKPVPEKDSKLDSEYIKSTGMDSVVDRLSQTVQSLVAHSTSSNGGMHIRTVPVSGFKSFGGTQGDVSKRHQTYELFVQQTLATMERACHKQEVRDFMEATQIHVRKAHVAYCQTKMIDRANFRFVKRTLNATEQQIETAFLSDLLDAVPSDIHKECVGS